MRALTKARPEPWRAVDLRRVGDFGDGAVTQPRRLSDFAQRRSGVSHRPDGSVAVNERPASCMGEVLDDGAVIIEGDGVFSRCHTRTVYQVDVGVKGRIGHV